jgi:hypothetical protein
MGLGWDTIESGALILLDSSHNPNHKFQWNGQNWTSVGPILIMFGKVPFV